MRLARSIKRLGVFLGFWSSGLGSGRRLAITGTVTYRALARDRKTGGGQIGTEKGHRRQPPPSELVERRANQGPNCRLAGIPVPVQWAHQLILARRPRQAQAALCSRVLFARTEF